MVDPVVNRWDVSPIALIVREAGGRYTDFAGGEAIADQALSTNGHVHSALLEALRA